MDPDSGWQEAKPKKAREQQARHRDGGGPSPKHQGVRPGGASQCGGRSGGFQGQAPKSDYVRGGGQSKGGGNRGRGRSITFVDMPLTFNKPYKAQAQDYGWKTLPDREDEIIIPSRPSMAANIYESTSKILANFFRTKIKLPKKLIHYQMFFSRAEDLSTSFTGMSLRQLNEEVAEKIRFSPDVRTSLANCLTSKIEKAYAEATSNTLNPGDIAGVITDFSDAMYSCVELEQYVQTDWDIPGEELGPDSDSTVNYRVAIRRTQETIDTTALQHDINDMKGRPVPQVLTDIERVYNVLVRCYNTEKYTPVGRSSLVDFVEDGGYPLTKGLVSYKGYNVIQCLSNGWKPYLNVDIANNACIPNTSLLSFLAHIFTTDREKYSADECGNVNEWTAQNFVDANSRLKGVRIVYHPKDGKALGGTVLEILRTSVRDTTFQLDDKENSNQHDKGAACPKVTTIEKYCEENYTDKNGRPLKLKYPHGPCLKLKGTKNRIVAGELCKVVKGQSFNQKLDDIQTSRMIDVSRKNPQDLYNDTMKVYKDLNLGNNPLAKKYGASYDSNMLSMKQTRILPAPQILYGKGTEGNKRAVVTPTDGVWDAWGSGGQFEFFEPKNVNKWAILDLANCPDEQINLFTQKLEHKAKLRNMTLSRKPDFLVGRDSLKYLRDKHDYEVRTKNLSEIKKVLTVYKRKGVDFVLVIIPTKNGPLYAQVKQVAELDVGVLTQCVAQKNFILSNRTESIIANILVKLHSKLGGVNHVVQAPDNFKSEFEIFTSAPVMILGADVTHPSQNGQGGIKQPSLAAVTGSFERNGMPYMMSVEAQEKAGKGAAEVIVNLKGIMVNFLRVYKKKNNGTLPIIIFYYRDGVGSGQFKEVLHKEMRAIRQACNDFDAPGHPPYQPRITFVTVQKRNKVRFFKDNGQIVNANAGTVIDEEITHPTEHDFFLIPHQGILGTSRPTRCHVLWDDSEMSMNKIQLLTYYLCYMYVRCNRAVRIPAPTYYAHWAAARAKTLVEGTAPSLMGNIADLNRYLRQRQNFSDLYPMHFI